MTEPRENAPADVEVGGRWRARRAERHRGARVETRTSGGVESEELREGVPDAPEGRRWRMRAWLRDPRRQET